MIESDYRLVVANTDHIDSFWPRILPWAEDFCQHSQGSYDPPYILANLQKGAMQCWLVMKGEEIRAVILTEIRKTIIKECVIVVTTGEDMSLWIHLLKTLENYAILMGCQKIIGIARPGWEKVLKPFGYKKTHVELEKMLQV